MAFIDFCDKAETRRTYHIEQNTRFTNVNVLSLFNTLIRPYFKLRQSCPWVFSFCAKFDAFLT